MCECDLEQPRLYRETDRKARKQYKCCECGTLINPGDIYVDIFGVWDEPKAFKQCVECNKIGSKLAQWNECGYPLGRLYQELIDSEILDCNENKEWKSLTNWVEISNQKPLKCVLIEVQNG